MLIAAGVLLLLCICLVTLGGIFAAGVRRASASGDLNVLEEIRQLVAPHLPVSSANVTEPAEVKYLPRKGWRPSA